MLFDDGAEERVVEPAPDHAQAGPAIGEAPVGPASNMIGCVRLLGDLHVECAGRRLTARCFGRN